MFDVMVNSRTFKDLCNEIKDFQAPVLFSSTFKALNLGEKNSSTFKDACEPCSKQPTKYEDLICSKMRCSWIKTDLVLEPEALHVVHVAIAVE